ncbi:helix-turn-helix domain-containing protein [Paenibacillus sinopodophylli]|uniref:helix-turn-helix domain-containing protein n=1 Tax=Paenibacillus sinopodophylli TaxID=1837342 RepID=UPI00110D0821|nr:AraC family transcriptional regulator [Paenibacillus sinopodophylli]
MSSAFFLEDLICTDSGYKPSDLHHWGGVRNIFALHYVVSGAGYYEVGRNIYTLTRGESFIIFPNTEVYYYPDPDDPWEYVWVDFKGAEALRLLSMTQFAEHTPIVSESPVRLEMLFRQIETGGMAPYQRERSNARLHLLLSYYIEHFPQEKLLRKNDYVVSTKEYIENNYWKTALTVSDIVEYVSVERSYLFRLFKEATGMSVVKYVKTVRMKRACALLHSSNLSIKVIAWSVGYQDQLYFSKVFKKATSYTPSEYMKKNTVASDQR